MIRLLRADDIAADFFNSIDPSATMAVIPRTERYGMSDCRVTRRWRESGFLLGQRRQCQDETPDNCSRQRNGPEGFKDRDGPEWFVVLVNKVLIHHRNLHSQSAPLKATVVRVKPSSVGAPPRLRLVAALPEVDLDLRMDNPCKRDVVVLTACLRIVLRQLDLVGAFHMVHGPDMRTVRT